MYVHAMIETATKRFGSSTALIDSQATRSFRELWDRSHRLAFALLERGVEPGRPIVAVMHNRNEWAEFEIAASLSGACRGRLNARDSHREWSWTLADLEPAVVVAGPEFAQALAEIRAGWTLPPFEVLVLGEGGSYEKALATAKPRPLPAFDTDLPGMAYHTSGTTGKLKAAVYTHDGLCRLHRNVLALIMDDVTPEAALLHVGPVTHMSGMLIVPSLFRGARSVMLEQFTPDAFFDAVERHAISHTILAPTIINMLTMALEEKPRDVSSLKRIYYASSPIAPAVLKRAIAAFGRPIFLQGYGCTEGGALFNAVLYPEEHVEALAHNPARLASCGRAVPFFDVDLRRPDGSPAPAGEPGEIWVRGDAVSQGYWRRPEATAESYAGGWFRTGDMATRDAEGYITILDRKHDMIISGGFNVYPHEVEDVIAEHAAVAEVAVIGVPDPKWGEAVKACVVLRPQAALRLKDLQEHCTVKGLAAYKKPLSLDILDQIPKTAVGKISRRLLRETYWQGQERRVG
jgi:acyl-CoA synthetase (AMP-forming)/AMP-acid ligase II